MICFLSLACAAKLAVGCAQLFHQARVAADHAPDFRAWLDASGYSYRLHFSHQINFWNAQAHWHDACALAADAMHHGVELARLQVR